MPDQAELAAKARRKRMASDPGQQADISERRTDLRWTNSIGVATVPLPIGQFCEVIDNGRTLAASALDC